ncbi:MAG: hypothetical protein DWI22_05840 [Planctomycetota bacterium]|nr:MAG: hypothetical protein DWI22_05840 [Planctomycetota bacterium]
MMAVPLDRFKQQLLASSLMSSTELDVVLAGLSSERPPRDGEQLARLLVKEQKLTAYQAQQIFSGKGKSLVMGNYVILDKLGQGGMGMVLKARHKRMDRIVALKILSPTVTQNPESARRFQREVKAAARLEHPNVVTAYDADEANATHFLVMQYVDGTDLSVLIKEQGPLSVEKAVGCVLQAACGLQYAHSQGVVHRDIKPANLLLDSSGTVKILDMGLARLDSAGAEQDQLTGTGQIMGTIDYMAPEQALDTKHADARADIYALGVTLWYLLTGRSLYAGGTVVMKLLAHQNHPIPSLRQACPHASPELEAAFEKMVAKTPESRFQSMTEVIADLARCTGSSSSVPMVATAPGEDSRLSEFLRAMTSLPEQAVMTKAPAKKKVGSPPTDRTMAMFSSKVGTDPQTQQSLLRPVAARTTRRRPPDCPWWKSLTTQIAGGGASVLLLAAIIFFMRTKDGLIRVEINDPEIEVAIKGTDIVLKQADQGTDVKLSAGDHTIIVQRGDFTFETDKLVLKRGDTVTVKVELLAGQVQVHQGDMLLGQGPLPEQIIRPDAEPQIGSGWHGWPAEAPPPATAPFNAEQAQQHQEAWAKYLDVPVEYTNSIGMKFRLIPPGEFTMGSTKEEIEEALKFELGDGRWQECMKSEAPQHKVILTQPIYLGVNEVTQAEYEKVMGVNPSYFAPSGEGKEAVAGLDTGRHPVELVSWNDAAEFCAKVSQQEKLKPFYLREGETITPLDGTGYRLPTEAEWEYSCRAGTTTKFWIGDKDEELVRAGWFRTNFRMLTHAAGQLKANPYGLFDIHGNVFEWVEDWWEPTYYGEFQVKPSVDPIAPPYSVTQRVIRGGDWHDHASSCRAAGRHATPPAARHFHVGFRVSLGLAAVRRALKMAGPAMPQSAATAPSVLAGWHGWPAEAPPPAIAPFDAEQAKKHQEAWAKYLDVPVEYTNSIGMKFRLIPPGEFTMGSTKEEIEEALKITGKDTHWQECMKSEAPQHKVILTQPIYLGVNEVTQAEYEKVMGINPSGFASMGTKKEAVTGMETTSHPVETVSWNDAAEFCAKLSKQEELKPFYSRAGETITPLDGTGYRLPTEAEWEYACRAGTTTKYWIGDKDEDLVRADWFGTKSGGRTHAAGELKANPYGLCDIHGNVWEWVEDWWGPTYYGESQEKPAINPNAPSSAGSLRVLRGGHWFDHAFGCRAADRYAQPPTSRHGAQGFRVSLGVAAVRRALKMAGPAMPQSAATAPSVLVGWHGWPAEAPPPAIAPFDAEQAKKHQEAWAKYLGVPVEYTNSIGMKFRLIPPGEFTMGSTKDQLNVALNGVTDSTWENMIKSGAPQHQVILTQPIYLGVNEVTQADYQKVMGINPSHFTPMSRGKEAVAGMETTNHPVEGVTWNDAAEFCARLSEQEELKPFYFRDGETITPREGTGYRLPTEAEWECACRAGTTTKYWFGDKDEDLMPNGWFQSNSVGRTHAVGELKANPYGLFDIHGNICEWVQDGWDASWYRQFQEKPAINPSSPFSAGSQRVIRGGHWHYHADTCRSALRFAVGTTHLGYDIGFRVSLVANGTQFRKIAGTFQVL